MAQTKLARPDGAWTWLCHACGWNLINTNTVEKCDECGTPMRCDAAGGHSDLDNDSMCDRGCGYNFRTGKTDLSKRRADY